MGDEQGILHSLKRKIEDDGTRSKKRQKLEPSDTRYHNGDRLILFEQGMSKIHVALQKIVKKSKEAGKILLQNNAYDIESVKTQVSSISTWDGSIYDTTFYMCVQREPCNYSQKIYDSMWHIFEIYLYSECEGVDALFQKKNGGPRTINDVHQWVDDLLLLYCMSFNLKKAVRLGFSYLDRFLTPNASLPRVEEQLDTILFDLFKRNLPNSKRHVEELCYNNDWEVLHKIYTIVVLEWFWKDTDFFVEKLIFQSLKIVLGIQDDLIAVIMSFTEYSPNQKKKSKKLCTSGSLKVWTNS